MNRGLFLRFFYRTPMQRDAAGLIGGGNSLFYLTVLLMRHE